MAWAGLVLAGPGCSPLRASEGLLADAHVQRFIADMVQRHGFERAELAALFAQARVLQRVLEAFEHPAEARPWYRYRPLFVTPARIASGVEFWTSNRALLARAEATYGVPAQVIVAIIGVESHYGQRKGSIRVVDALVTLAFRYPRRSEFFRRELEEFLLLMREERLEATGLTGSYAGAMGVPQFIPSSYRRYAVDFDGDQVRDLSSSAADAIGSIGNYLKRHGWRAQRPVAAPATVAGDAASALVALGLEPKVKLQRMKELGVTVAAGLPDGARGALIELETESGREYWVGLQNFYTITRYNHSKLYAMAVHQLATAIQAEYMDSTEG